MSVSSGGGERDADVSPPPQCPGVFHVGVTGHRFLPDADRKTLAQTVIDVLAEVRTTAVRIAASGFAGEEPSLPGDPLRLRLISSLAAGADSLVAEEALKQGYELESPFPFPRKIYADDFQGEDAVRWEALTAQASAVAELDGDRANAAEAYLAAGLVVLDRSDLLIAIWDGKEARGTGGTAQIVKSAIASRIPVLAIDAFAPHAVHFLNAALEAGRWRNALEQVMVYTLAPSAGSSCCGRLPSGGC